MSETTLELPKLVGKLCKANASEYGRIAAKTRWQAYHARKLALQIALDNPNFEARQPEAKPEDDPLRKDTLAQIKDLDKEYAKATDLADKLKIAGIKEKLWRLIIPSPGSLKPKSPKQGRQSSDSPEPESA